MPTLLRVLREDSRNWWWHARLREQGQHAEAARLERQDTKRDLAMLREAMTTPGAHLFIGHGGFQLHYGGGFLSGHDVTPWVEACRILHIPIINVRATSQDQLLDNINILGNIPSVAVGAPRDAEPPPGPCLSAPLRYVARLYARVGAVIEGIQL